MHFKIKMIMYFKKPMDRKYFQNLQNKHNNIGLRTVK